MTTLIPTNIMLHLEYFDASLLKAKPPVTWNKKYSPGNFRH